MKTIILAILALVTAYTTAAGRSLLPEMTVRMSGEGQKRLKDCLTGEKATLFIFWKTCCPNNITMIDELTEIYDPECGIDIVLVSLDDQRSSSRVSAVASSSSWEYPIILDRNLDLARAADALVPPMWILYGSNGEELYRCKINAGITDTELQFRTIMEQCTTNSK